ncbi:MAG: phosphoribosyltransferase family protein [Bacteroidia bacterium]|nr:phosphoribosyltransferase family protein [Bacteroidia bacterium]MDW8134670.1 phosphoribosyltransferase family protein [Bacteroidia bacterium]
MVGRRILTPSQVERALYRIALEVLERHYNTELPLLWGVSPRGRPFALRLHHILQQEGSIVEIANEASQIPVNKSLLLVDDVLYTGRTIMSQIVSLWHKVSPPQIEVAVVVDRGHRSFPIVPNYVGLQLATTLQEYVEVRSTEEGWEVWLV